jgi:ATP-dependent protease ClpP protease subunit
MFLHKTWQTRKRKRPSKSPVSVPAAMPAAPTAATDVTADDDDDDAGALSFAFPKLPTSNVYSASNHIYFNDDITTESVFALNRELHAVKMRNTILKVTHGLPVVPIYLHITTNGGCIHSAFSVVDTIKTLGIPVYTVVEGTVSSAGTLISLAGEKKYIMPNAYMLLHELRSGVWGKMSNIEEEIQNLRKMMDHLYEYYEVNTKLTRRALEKLLTKDVIWDVQECLAKGIVDDIYSAEN